MSSIRDAAAHATRDGVVPALAATGRSITTAGLIFAGLFAAMLAGGVTNLAQYGFTIGFGLLLDIFVVRSLVVRSLVVPAMTVLVGDDAWWPRRPVHVQSRASAAPTPYPTDSVPTQPAHA